MQASISGFFESVLVRLGLIFSALALMTVAAIVVSWIVFQSIAANMATLSEERLPELRESAAVVSVTGRLREMLSDLLISQSVDDVSRSALKSTFVVSDIRSAAAEFEAEEAALLNGQIDTVEAALADLIAARETEFESADGVAKAVKDALILSTQATGLLAEAADTAFFDLVIGGEETISDIDATLTQLIEADFALYQATLSVRAEINLLSGLALGATQTRDQAIRSILQDLGNAAEVRLEGILPVLDSAPATREIAALVADAKDQFVQTIDSNRNVIAPADILATRQTLDAALSSAQDDIYFDLVINSDDAKEKNSTAIQTLLDGQVARIRTQAMVETATQGFFSSVMQTALARNPLELDQRAGGLAVASAQLRDAINDVSPEVGTRLEAILEVANADTGIAAIRSAAFDAQAQAAGATRAAAQSVRDISVIAGDLASASKNGIDATMVDMNQQVSDARTWLLGIGAFSAAIVALAPLLIWLMVTRPLKNVTGVTERLAAGDLSEISTMSGYKGEIGQLARALHVFRNGALDRIKLQEEEQRRERKVAEAERLAEDAKREALEKERLAAEEREREEREREQTERRVTEDRRKKKDAENRQRVMEQETVVGALAAGLKKLSGGDLTYTITDTFPVEYEALKEDYNTAVASLTEVISNISKSASTIDGSSSEISSSALDLSRRTESSAATLEETSAALNQLTSSVATSAKGAVEAADTVEKVRKDAQNGETVMHQAVKAMDQIKVSSNEITQIVEVIDSIAFQTNLLALNAGVEAARAGESGRGFAVVASEVRILAHRCSEAALQINALISDSAGHVENGVALLDEVKNALFIIRQGVTQVSQNVSDIAGSVREQSGGIHEINSAVEALDRTTQQNAAMFEETTAASQSLMGEASTLARMIGRFHFLSNSARKEANASDVRQPAA